MRKTSKGKGTSMGNSPGVPKGSVTKMGNKPSLKRKGRVTGLKRRGSD